MRYIAGMVHRTLPLLLVLTLTVSCALPDGPNRRSPGDPNSTTGDLNPGRGYYQWRGMQVVPPHRDTPAADSYQRFNWNQLQKDDGTYDFSAITALFDAHPRQRISFRIRSMVDYGKAAKPGDDLPKFVPETIPGWEADTIVPHDGIPDVFIPDWNSEAYLAGVESLFTALAAELAKPDPANPGATRADRIGWIDVGMFGQYGEWYLRTQASNSSPDSPWVDYGKAPQGITAPTDFADAEGNPKKRIVDAQLKAFPQSQWVMFFLYDQRYLLDYLFHHQTITELPVGWRFDGLGADQFLEKQWQLSNGKASAEKLAWWDGIEGRPGFKDRWKVAPVVCEYYGPTADPIEALRQVREFHIGQVGNGNFTSGGGTDAEHWFRVPEEDKTLWAQVGKEAGWRLKVDSGAWTVTDGTFTWKGRVSNPGNAPAWGTWGTEVRFADPEQTAKVAIAAAFPLPGESVELTLTGSLPTGATTPRTWVPTFGGIAAKWTGGAP